MKAVMLPRNPMLMIIIDEHLNLRYLNVFCASCKCFMPTPAMMMVV